MLNITNHQEMQTKTTVTYIFTPVRMATVKKSTSNKCWQGYEEEGNFMNCWWDCKLVQSPCGKVYSFFKKLIASTK